MLDNMDIQTTNTRRKILNQVVCSILVECGYDTCEKQAVETLTEMLQSCKDPNRSMFLTSYFIKLFKLIVHVFWRCFMFSSLNIIIYFAYFCV